MAYTGYLIIQYVDDNPNSSTYGEVWTERVLNETTCPSGGDGEWSLVSSECEMDTSGFTGYRVNVYYNDALNQYSSTTVADADCSTSAETYTEEEIWVNSGDPYCQIDEDGNYTGWGVQLQVQKNFNLPNYGETKEVRILMPECSLYIEPQWEEINRQCHVTTDVLTGYLIFDGTVDILQIDVNPSSPTYNTTRTINEESEDCVYQVCDRIEEEWRFVDDICGIQMPPRYGLTGLTDDTVYHVYRKYGTCIIDGRSGRTTPMNEFSAVTYQTGVNDCVERWVETDETICNYTPSIEGKFKLWTTNSRTYEQECNSSPIITSGEVRSITYDYPNTNMIEIGSCATEIGEYAFQSMDKVLNVSIPTNIAIIGEGAFSECTGLTTVGLSSGLTAIGYDAFGSCNNLTGITIPNSVTSISGYAFGDCISLTNITIPDSITSISEGTFWHCTGLTSVTLPNTITTIGNKAFEECRSLTNINIPNGVTNIGDRAFYLCSSLNSLTIPSSVTSIGSYAFGGCRSLTLTIDSNDVTTSTALSGAPISGVIVNTNAIGNRCFEECNNLKTLVIGNTVTSIGDWAFSNCDSLESITIPSNVTSIGQRAFQFCDNLAEVTIYGNGTTSIGNYAFQQCSGLTDVTIGSGVKSIGDDVFNGCTGLTSVTIGNDVTSIGASAFGFCSGLTTVTIPDSVTSIGNGAFNACSGLTDVTIGSGVTSIGSQAFYRCKNLASIIVKATTPPILGNASAFDDTNNSPIYVPAESVNSYKTASGWSSYANRITAIIN